MNILTDLLPTAVEVNGQEYPINSDFRACIRVILAFEDPELTGYEKQMVMLKTLYPQQPDDLQVAVQQAVKFLDGGHAGDGEDSGPQLRLYSFEKDAGFIFAAFHQTHGIDLETANMHWWKFLALFMDLGADTTFCGLTGLRKRIKTGTASKEDRQIAREMGEAFDLPEFMTPDERSAESEFMKLLEEGKHAKANL